MIHSISFIILNYNGKYLTENCIDSLKESINNSSLKEYEIIVVDNGSKDGSVEYLKNKFKDVVILEIKKNNFITSYNDGVKIAKFDWVFLLNNDMLFDKNFLEPIIRNTNLNNLFGIGSKLLKFDGNFEKGVNKIKYKYGLFWFYTENVDEKCETFYIGTHGIFNKSIFIELGGFDEIFKPFYFEDVDLCYRAQKRGYRILYEPKSIIYHKHMGTIKDNFSKIFISKIYARNRLIFHYKNLTNQKLFLKFVIFLPFLIIGSLFTGKGYYFQAFLDFIRKINILKEKRKIEKKVSLIDDEKIIYKYI